MCNENYLKLFIIIIFTLKPFHPPTALSLYVCCGFERAGAGKKLITNNILMAWLVSMKIYFMAKIH